MKTLTQFFDGHVEQYAENPFMWEHDGTGYQPATYREIHQKVQFFAAGLLDLGIKKGDRLALIAEGRNAWVISEMGILYAGGVNVPLSVQLKEENDLVFRLKHSGTRMVIASRSQADKILAITEKLPDLEKVIHLDPRDSYGEKELYFGDILEKGKEKLDTEGDAVHKVAEAIEPGDLANICYTSGTTADPKGIMLSHRNYTANTEQALTLMNIPPSYRTLLILPWDHSFGHTAGVFSFIASGASIASVKAGKTPVETLRNVPKNIQEIKPNLLMSVPALAKNFRKNIEKGIREKGRFTWGLFNHALRVAYRYNGIGWNRGKGMRIFLKPLVALYDAILFKKIRAFFGGELDFFIGGGALLDIELQRFFYAIGIPMMQGYGLSEASPIISSNSLARHKLGSSGYLVENMELKICDEDGKELPVGQKGEIVIRGENVMLGYWKNEEATRETVKDGWLFTGDMGYMDKDGFLYVMGRFKSLLIADDGEKYSPEGIEEAFTEQSSFIDQCMLYNNQDPYTIVLVHPNRDALVRALESDKLDKESEEGAKEALEILRRELHEYRKGGKYDDLFPQRWMPASIGILDEAFSQENKMINTTMKMVRGKITEHYSDLIKYLYTAESKEIRNKRNLEAMKRLLKE